MDIGGDIKDKSLLKILSDKNKKLDLSDSNLKIPFYCNTAYAKIVSSDVALKMPFVFHDLSRPNVKNLFVRGYFEYWGGFAELTREITFRLLDHYPNYRVKVDALRTPVDVDPAIWERVNSLTRTPMFDEQNSIALIVAGPGFAKPEFLDMKSKYKIIYTMLETKEIPDYVQDDINNCDEAWVPTNVDINRFDKVKNIKRMRPGIDTTRYHRDIKPIDVVNLRNKFVFGVVGSWNIRKGIKYIIEGFCKAFWNRDDVALFLCSKYGTRPHGKEKDNEQRWSIKYEFQQMLKDMDLPKTGIMPQIVLNDLPMHENIMPHIYASFNALVGASLGESIWIPGLAAMSMGIPVIQVNNPCCGYLDYMNVDNSVLYDADGLIKAEEELVEGTSGLYKNQYFYRPDVYSLVRALQYTVNEYSILSRKSLDTMIDIREEYSWSKCVVNVDARLSEIFNGEI